MTSPRPSSIVPPYALAALDPSTQDELRAAAIAERPPSPELLERCATLLGVSIQRLLSGANASAPSVLFRRRDGDDAWFDALGREGLGLRIGRLVRDLSRAAELEPAAAGLPAWATPRPLDAGGTAPADAGRQLAAEVRAALRLGVEPIPSMWALAASLGVRCAAVTPDSLSQSIDGLSWRSPHPCLVVNLVGGAETWWRTRMTVAHELAHVLFDLPHEGLMISAERASSPLYWRFERIEQRANAFAAYLLAPPDGVLAVAAGRGATLAVAQDVATHFGVGSQTAIQTICNVLRAPPDERHRLLERRVELSAEHVDTRVPERPWAQLAAALARGARDGLVDGVRARVELGLHMSEALPPGFPDRAPILGRLERVRLAALRRARLAGWEDAVTGEVGLTAGGYHVELTSSMEGAPTSIHVAEHDLRG